MRRSKLQVNVSILKALANHGKMFTTQISYNTFLNHKSVSECLEFLVENNLVQELEIKKKTGYEITDMGLKAVKTATKINNALKLFSE